MKKNSYKNWLVILSSSLFLVSCNEQEFLDIKNENNATVEEKLENLTDLDAKLLVSGAYSDMQTTGLYARYGYFLFDHMSDELLVSTNSNDAALNQIQTLRLNPLSESTRLFYNSLFRGVFKANNAINIITGTTSSTISEKSKTYRIAEARFLRAFYYFKLVSRYGGVPIEDGLEKNKARSSERQVYEFIIEDLKFAAENLVAKGETEVGRPSKGAANALLGKVLLHSIPAEKVRNSPEVYEAAFNALSLVGGEGYDLVPDYLDNFNEKGENNIESLFEVGFVDKNGSGNAWGDGDGDNETSFQSADYSGWGNSKPNRKMIQAYESIGNAVTIKNGSGAPDPDDQSNFQSDITVTLDQEKIKDIDPRLYKTWFIKGQSFGTSGLRWGELPDKKAYEGSSNGFNAPTGGGIVSRKFSRLNENDFQETSESGVNFRVLRFADVLLMQAESALFKTTPSRDIAIENLNKIRGRARKISATEEANVPVNLPSINFPLISIDDIFEAIKRERQVELAMEGYRLVDLYRWGDDIKELSQVKTTYTRATGRYMPIPKEQLDTNPLIDISNPAPDLEK